MSSVYSSKYPDKFIGDISDIFSGYAFRSKDMTDNQGIPIIKIGNIQNRGVLNECVSYLPEHIFVEKLAKYILRVDDILIAMTGAGSTGRVGKMRRMETKYLVNQRVGIIRCDPDKCNPEYVYQLLSVPIVESEYYKMGLGAGQPNLSPANIGQLAIPFPPLPIQYKIAAILSAYDDLIENNNRRIQILEEMAQTLFRQWFVEFQFPGHEDVPQVDSGTELGEIPQGWEIRRFEDIAKVNTKSIRKGQAPELINYVDISSVSTGQIDEIRTVHFEDAPSRARRIVKHGDVIFATVRPNRRSYSLIIHPIPNLVVSTGFAVLTPKEVPYTYLYYAVTTDKFVEYLTNRAQGAAYPAVNVRDFKGADFIIPLRDLLSKFNMIVQDMVELKHSLLVKNTKLRATRDLLLPQLVNGELNVSKLDISGVE